MLMIGDVCVGCGVRITSNPRNHKCDDKRITRIEAARKGAVGRKEYRSFNQRLREGFSIISIREEQNE